MNVLILIFNTVLYRPLLNTLILLYEYIPGHDFGVAVIVLTLIIRSLLYPVSVRGVKSQKVLTDLQPKIQEIQKKYKDDKEKQIKLLMELYQKGKINPFSGCLPLLIQFPILVALYRVFLIGVQPDSLNRLLYGFVPNPGVINFSFLGLINLAEPNIFLAFLAGFLQFCQLKISTTSQQQVIKEKGTDFSKMIQQQMLYLLPIFTVYIIWQFGSIIGLYWIVSVLFSIGEQYIVKTRYA